MDIEREEYDVLDEIAEGRLEIQQVLVEFHHRFPGVGIDRTRRAITCPQCSRLQNLLRL